MSRRQVRLGNQLSDLADAVERLGIYAPDTSAADDRLAGIIRRFLLPRLTDPPPPLVVALVGSTGAGKSTLLNSLAGSTVSRPGILRPTTNESVVWTSAAHAGRWWPGPVAIGDHPLAESVALIDTPDLDSNVADHRLRALEAVAASDAVVFVTTSSRYGDASPWEVLLSVAGKPMVVVINRLQTRAAGARNDLMARLRSDGLGSVPVLTISEQRVDPARGRLSPQSVQRLAAVLRDWAGQTRSLRIAALETATDGLAADLVGLVERVGEQAARTARVDKRVVAAYETARVAIEDLAGQRAGNKKRWRIPRRRRQPELAFRLVALVDAAAAGAAAAMTEEGLEVFPEMQRGSRSTVTRLSRLIEGQTPPDRDALRRFLQEDRDRFRDWLPAPPEGVVEVLQAGVDLITNLDWRNV